MLYSSEELKNMCTVVVCSCDKYENTWIPFFTVLKNCWKDNPFPIVLNTESKSFTMNDMDIKCLQLFKDKKEKSWSDRLKANLKAINTKYVIILLEDFFMEKDVDTNKIIKCMNWMENDNTITCFNFYKTICKKKDCQYPEFSQRTRFSQYKFNTQACLWNREDLISYLRRDENPWVWEFVGNIRSFFVNKKFYCCADDADMAFTYTLPGIVRGHWNGDLVEPIVEKYGIELDYTKMPRASREYVIAHTNELKEHDRLFFLRIIHSYIYNILKYPKSLFKERS